MRDPAAGAMPAEDERDYVYVPVVLPDSLFGEREAQQGLDVVVVADLSAGTDPARLELGCVAIEALAQHLDAGDRLAIFGADARLRPLALEEPLGAATPERVETFLDALAREPAGGASDLCATFAEAAEVFDDPSRSSLVVYVGDGAPTVGELAADDLLAHLERLPRPLRLYALAIGDEADLGLLATLTRGGGLAERVVARPAAADAALRMLAHAREPVAQRVEVTLEGVEQVFPRRPVAVRRGDVLAVVGRVEDAVPGAIHVAGEVAGEAFALDLQLRATTVEDSGDLRLRWASERLEQLLPSGASREEVADLGIRYGLITPYTSFYVPSAAELSALGRDAWPLFREEERSDASWARYALVPFLPILSLTGCSDTRQESVSSASGEAADFEMGAAEEQATSNRFGVEGSSDDAPAPPGAADRAGLAQLGYVDSAEEAEPAPEPATTEALPAVAGQVGAAELDADEDVGDVLGAGGLGLRGSGRGGGGEGEGSIGLGNIGTIGHGAGGGSGSGYGRGAAPSSATTGAAPRTSTTSRARSARRAPANAPEAGRPRPSEARERGEANALTELLAQDDRDAERSRNQVNVQATLSVTFDASRHQSRRCSEAADLLLDARRDLWRERLQGASYAGAWLQVYRDASARCELPSWRDRRALLELMLARAGSIAEQISLYRASSGASLRDYLRRAILRRVRTPEDLRLARQAFGRGVEQQLIAQVLERATTPDARIAALYRLVSQFPDQLDLRIQLLRELSRADRADAAKRVALELRAHPLCDAEVRTTLGELYLRAGDEADARRVFGEIVEFAPSDASARRRLGDLYRAHGWHEDAYRQYVTLAELTPDDPSVLLLMAQAAAGAGRVDEALRLERRLAETAPPGNVTGLARVAQLWSSVRFAELRQAADGDDERLAALDRRRRESGVLRAASPFRATLTWSHPDADLSLWGAFPGLGFTRPPDIAPAYGIEAFDVPELEPGSYRVEVRRSGTRLASTYRAKLIFVWNEGRSDERIEIRELEFGPGQMALAFEVVGGELREAELSPEARRIDDSLRTRGTR